MSQSIYKMHQLKWKDAWYELTPTERENLIAQVDESFTAVGGKSVLFCNSAWSSEAWMAFGVEEYPSLEAVQKHADDLLRLNWFHYVESQSSLGTQANQGEPV
jgi:hypothetical protein